MPYDELIEWCKFLELRRKEEQKAHENAKRKAKSKSSEGRQRPVKHRRKDE